MPKWKCLDCSTEFWGWAVYYSTAPDGSYECPECGGALVGYGGRARKSEETARMEAAGF